MGKRKGTLGLERCSAVKGQAHSQGKIITLDGKILIFKHHTPTDIHEMNALQNEELTKKK